MPVTQFALPLKAGSPGPDRIVVGAANAHVAQALSAPRDWPYRVAVLKGPPRSGKSLFARWFAQSGGGESIDDADDMPEDRLFHRWNQAQQDGVPLLLTAGEAPWRIALPDLRSRLGAALQLEIGPPDDAMAEELLHSLARERGLALGPDGVAYLVPRASRAQADLERLVATIDRLSLERKAPATQSIWRAALEAVMGPDEPRLL